MEAIRKSAATHEKILLVWYVNMYKKSTTDSIRLLVELAEQYFLILFDEEGFVGVCLACVRYRMHTHTCTRREEMWYKCTTESM